MLVQSVTMPGIRSATSRRAFTFLEVLACLLVVGLGLASVVAMVYFGIVKSQKTMAASTAMVTAMTVAVDVRPFLAPDVALTWNIDPRYNFDDTTSLMLTQKAQGFINGYLVERIESTTKADVVAVDTPPGGGNPVVYARSVLVKVSVYTQLNGPIIASFNTRFVRQRSSP